jgi:hypothetical protein
MSHQLNGASFWRGGGTHVLRSSKQVNELLTQRPDPIPLSERYREQRKVLRSTVGIPMTDISFIINQGCVSSTLPNFIFVLHRLQLAILIHGIRKHEDTRLRNIPEIVRGGGWERSDQYGRVWSGDPCVLGRLGFEFNRDCVYVLNVCFFVEDHMCNDTRGQPECLTAISERDLERLDGCFHGCDVNRLLVPVACNIQRLDRETSDKTGKERVSDTSPRVLCATMNVVRESRSVRGARMRRRFRTWHALGLGE